MTGAVLFDCDSTLSAVEGIDVLARRAGVYDVVAPLTRAAMEGVLTVEAVYRKRLEMIRPNRATVSWLGEQYIEHRVAGAEETVAVLHRLGREVHIISGGIRQAVLMLAQSLGIADTRVHAVELRFDAAGDYLDFDTASPLCRNGGKAEICRRVLATAGSAVMIGDGVTDLEALEVGVPVILYGGIVARAGLARRATAYVVSPTLTAVLENILTPAELSAIRH